MSVPLPPPALPAFALPVLALPAFALVAAFPLAAVGLPTSALLDGAREDGPLPAAPFFRGEGIEGPRASLAGISPLGEEEGGMAIATWSATEAEGRGAGSGFSARSARKAAAARRRISAGAVFRCRRADTGRWSEASSRSHIS